jgi:hypothetical protein
MPLRDKDAEFSQLRTLGNYHTRDDHGLLITLSVTEGLAEHEGRILYRTPLGATPSAVAEALRELARQVEARGFED